MVASPGRNCRKVCRKRRSGRSGWPLRRANRTHLYALIESKKGVLWDSKDLGDHWTQVNDRREIAARGFYFTKLEVAPDNPNRLYFLSFDILVSDDGGKTAKKLRQGRIRTITHVDRSAESTAHHRRQ